MATEANTVYPVIKQKVLLLYPYYWPFYKAGGPVQSLFNIAATFKEFCDFFVIALNKDLDAAEADPSVETNQWTAGPNGERIYFSPAISFFLIRKIIKTVDPDTIFVNGIFNANTTIPGLICGNLSNKRVIISPRGMLQEWGLKRKALFKKVYLAGLRLTLNKHAHWHATDENEVLDITRIFGKGHRIHVASNIPRKVSPSPGLTFPNKSEKIKLVFLSLINPNKNLHLVIDAVQSLSWRFTLDIYGPIIDKDYWAGCEKKIGNSDFIRHKGPVPPWQVPTLLADYHFFILPTQGENFGHAIFDALASGVPVIISKNTPWKDIEEKRAGFYIDLDSEGSLTGILDRISGMDQMRYDTIRTGSLLYAREYWQKKDYATEYAFLINGK